MTKIVKSKKIVVVTSSSSSNSSSSSSSSSWSWWLFRIVILPILLSTFGIIFCWRSDDSKNAAAVVVGKKNNGINKDPSRYVEIYDSILPETVRSKLHEECVKLDIPDVVFDYPLEINDDGSSNGNYIEQVLNDVVTELYDDDDDDTNPDGYYVEYWTRNEWYHTLGHADMDEGLQKSHQQQQQKLVHPIYGHVLYLQIGTKVRGPTVVFLDGSRGGDLLYHNHDSEEEESNNSSIDRKKKKKKKVSCCYNNDTIHMVISPSVTNRLLKFNGNLLHAVPRPADIWFTRKQLPPHLLQDEPKDKWERSVLLFNIWPKSHLLTQKTITNSKKKKKNENGGNSKPSNSPSSSILCNARDQWTNAMIQSLDGPKWYDMSYKIFELPLLGDTFRRGTAEDVFSIQLQAISTIRDALFSRKVPYHVQLSPPITTSTSPYTSILTRFIDYIRYELLQHR